MARHIICPDDISLSDFDTIAGLTRYFWEKPDLFFSVLNQQSVFLVFDENSTRTRLSFALAAKKLGAAVVNFYPQSSSLSKGETFLDTLSNIAFMGANFIVARHTDNNIFDEFLRTRTFSGHFISGGHGTMAHPTQGLLDIISIMLFQKKAIADISIAIVGDIRHSRVARSQVNLLRKLGCQDIRIVCPPFFMPDNSDPIFKDLCFISKLAEGINSVDVVSLLRVQCERIEPSLSFSRADYSTQYGLTAEHLKKLKPNTIVIHPQPINRGVELLDEVMLSPRVKIFEQVAVGVAVRMACLSFLAGISDISAL